MRKVLFEKPTKEELYRASRVARALGNPAKYMIVSTLYKPGQLSVVKMAKKVCRSRSIMSYHLLILRGLDIVRYEVKADGVYYWIKYPEEFRAIQASLKPFVPRA